MRLQMFGHRESRYERPTLDWCCGGAEACTLGPDASGRCRAGPSCQPVKDGELYKCARSAVAGGPCQPGPGPNGECGCTIPPCVPRPTLRAQRGRLARWAILVATAVVLIALSVNSRHVWLAGPLSAGHSQIGECTQCHASADDSVSVWLHQAFMPTDPVAASESCISCHDRGGAALAMAPHNQPSEVLQQWRETGTSTAAASDDAPLEFALAAAVFGPPQKGDDGPVACATCHQEHRGGMGFTALSDAGCQSCHQAKFGRFPDSHPDFGNYPYQQRQHIAFNHASHIDLHFPKADAALRPETCTACHVADSTGKGMLTTGYEATCASCHDGDIRKGPAAGPPGGPFLAVPGLDLDTLAAESVAIGFWPDSFYDRGIPPVMQALLSAGYMAPAKLALLQNVDLLDLTDAPPEVLEAVAAFAWATKAMVADMLQTGVLADAGAMQDVLDIELDAAQISRLGGSVPRDVIALAADAWFGCTLYTEVSEFRAGNPLATLTLADRVDGKPPSCVDASPDGGEAVAAEAEDGAGDDGAAGHGLAESALDALADTPLDGAALGDSPLGGGDGILGEDALAGEGDGPIGDGGGDILGGNALDDTGNDPAAESGGDILGGAPLGEGAGSSILGDTAPADGSDAPGGDILGSGPLAEANDDGGILGGSPLGGAPLGEGNADAILGGIGDEAPPDDGATGQERETASGLVLIQPEPVDPAEWARHGGWYRSAEAVYYRPVEHADRFLHAWLDFAGAAHGTTTGKPLGEAIFESMGQPTSLGRCAKCHGAEQQADGSVSFKWQGRVIDMAERRVTDCRHAPHLTIAGADGCNLCHTVARGDDMMASFKGFDAKAFKPGFAAMTKETCAACHAAPESGSECQHCHNYHAGVFSDAKRMGKLTTAGAAAKD